MDAVAVVVAVAFAWRCNNTLGSAVEGHRDGLYGALAGVHAGLLGFVLAALAIVLGYAQLERFEAVRVGGHFPTLFDIYLAGVRTHTLALIACLVALFADRDDKPRELVTALVLALTALAIARLLRVIWVTRLVVGVVVKPTERAPGAR